jgi:hypothetical protein
MLSTEVCAETAGAARPVIKAAVTLVNVQAKVVKMRCMVSTSKKETWKKFISNANRSQ